MRILIISDIHANYTAFETVLDHAKGQWDYVWCLGDVVGYGPSPNECVDRLRELPHLCLAGNHDWAALDRLDIRTFNPDARRAVDWTRETLTDENTRWLEALPTTFVIGNYTLVHASPREPIWEYILEPLVAALNFPHFETPYCLVGHTHQPVIYEMVNDSGETDMRKPDYFEPFELNGHRVTLTRVRLTPSSISRRACLNIAASTTTLPRRSRRCAIMIYQSASSRVWIMGGEVVVGWFFAGTTCRAPTRE